MSYQIEYRHFKYFLSVAQELHFRKAAEKLYISQPGLSRQIKQLEDDMGVKLFERHNRKVELTPAGTYFAFALEKHFKMLDEVIEHTKLLNDGMAGKLTIGYVGSAMQREIPDLLLKFQEVNNKVLITLKEMDNSTQVEAILNNGIDVGFVRQSWLPKHIGVKETKEETFAVVLPKSHPITQDTFTGLSQFKDEHFILFDSQYSESYYETVMQIFDDSGFTPIISHSTVNASSIFRLVENKLGVSIVPTSLVQGYDMAIKVIELDKIPQRTSLKIIWNENNPNPVLGTFLELMG